MKTSNGVNIYFECLLLTITQNDHSITIMTSTEATNTENQSDFKLYLELKARRNRTYQEWKVGDKVKITPYLWWTGKTYQGNFSDLKYDFE